MKYEYWFIEYEGGRTNIAWMSSLDWMLISFARDRILSAVKLREVER